MQSVSKSGMSFVTLTNGGIKIGPYATFDQWAQLPIIQQTKLGSKFDLFDLHARDIYYGFTTVISKLPTGDVDLPLNGVVEMTTYFEGKNGDDNDEEVNKKNSKYWFTLKAEFKNGVPEGIYVIESTHGLPRFQYYYTCYHNGRIADYVLFNRAGKGSPIVLNHAINVQYINGLETPMVEDDYVFDEKYGSIYHIFEVFPQFDPFASERKQAKDVQREQEKASRNERVQVVNGSATVSDRSFNYFKKGEGWIAIPKINADEVDSRILTAVNDLGVFGNRNKYGPDVLSVDTFEINYDTGKLELICYDEIIGSMTWSPGDLRIPNQPNRVNDNNKDKHILYQVYVYERGHKVNTYQIDSSLPPIMTYKHTVRDRRYYQHDNYPLPHNSQMEQYSERDIISGRAIQEFHNKTGSTTPTNVPSTYPSTSHLPISVSGKAGTVTKSKAKNTTPQ